MLYPWLKPTYQQVTLAVSQGHGHHALLFKAADGLGADTLVNKVANWLLCTQPQGDQACLSCAQCLLFQANNHPDFIRLSLEEQSSIGIDQIRDISQKLMTYTHQHHNRVIYITDITYLTEAAANALLKILEEPQDSCYFLMQAPLSSEILPTIFSRCQTWIIPTPNAAETVAWLQQQTNETIEDRLTATNISHNQPLTALYILENQLLATRLTFLREYWTFFKNKNSERFYKAFNLQIIDLQITWLADFLLDCLKYKLNIRTNLLCTDLKTGIEQYASSNSISQLQHSFEIVNQLRIEIKNNILNQDLMIYDLLTKLILEVFYVEKQLKSGY